MENVSLKVNHLDLLPDLKDLPELQCDFPTLDFDTDEVSPGSSSGSSADVFTFNAKVKSEPTDVLTSCKVKKLAGKDRKKITSVDDYKAKRNIKERRRIKRIADGFTKLQNALPHCRGKKRLSKIDTLRNALSYIYHLSNILHEDDIRRNALQAEQMLTNPEESALPVHILIQSPGFLQRYCRPIFVYPAVVNQTSSQPSYTDFIQSFCPALGV